MSDVVRWRLTEPRRGWARWTWTAPAPYLRPTIPPELAEIPGVKVAEISPLEGYVEAHESACQTRAVDAFARGTDVLGFPWTEHCGTFREQPAGERARVRDAAVACFGIVRPLFPHQWVAFDAAAVSTSGILLGDEPGAGKTAAAAVAARMRAMDGIVLIVAPKYLRSTWKRELDALGLLRDERDFLVLESLDSSGLDDAMRDARWWFVHYDVLDAWASRITFNLTGRKPSALIADEIHNARSIKTKRGAAIARVAGSIPFRMALTGTPLVTRPSDMWNLLSVVDGPGSWGTLFSFRCRYAGAFQTDHGFKDGAPTHTDEFQARLKGRYLARTKAEVGLSLPPLLRSVIDVEKGAGFDDELKGLMRHYHVSAEDIVEALRDGGGVGELVLKALHALRRHTSAAKRKATLELLDDIVEARQSALVFVQERATAEQLSFELARTLSYKGLAQTYYLHGGCTDADREATIDTFQRGLDDGRPRVLFATYGALREGVTLTAASHVVLHDLDWTPAIIFQAEARAHRMTVRHSVTSHWMVLADSIDTLFAAALLRKAREQRELLAASSAADALEDLGLAETAGAPSVEDDARRLISSWGGVSW